MTIIGSATIYSIYTSQQLFNGQVTIEISTDGKISSIGKLNFADNNLSVSGRLYANLSKISQGAATVLFLADVPDQVRILTLYGKLQMGFENAAGPAGHVHRPGRRARHADGDASQGPADGGTISASELNGRGYIDVDLPRARRAAARPTRRSPTSAPSSTSPSRAAARSRSTRRRRRS